MSNADEPTKKGGDDGVLLDAYLDAGIAAAHAREILDGAERSLLKLLSNLPRGYRRRAEDALNGVRLARHMLTPPKTKD